MFSFFDKKNILITGAAGTVGEALLAELVESSNPNRIVCLDNNESALFFLEQQYRDHLNVSFFLCDIRDYQDLSQHFKDIDTVFHVAALKHVVMCERSPDQAVATNIVGTQNVVRCASQTGVDRVLVTSSDKAVNPTNVMGTSKLMAERITTAANANSTNTIYSCTRFGNVLGSNGSVIPIFKKQIQDGQTITVTDKDMSRFVMTLQEAVDLVLRSCMEMKGGEIFVTKMPVMKIDTLADVMISLNNAKRDVQKKYIGSKPGEKLYEELMTDEEITRAIELEDFFVVFPAYRGFYKHLSCDYESLVNENVTDAYSSANETAMSFNETKEFLVSRNIVEIPASDFSERYWPGDSN